MKRYLFLTLLLPLLAYGATKALQGDVWKSADLTKTWTPPAASGTLLSTAAVVTVAQGGTNNTTAYTTGSVMFFDGTKVTEDNAYLFWNDTDNRLRVGTGTDSFTLGGSAKGSALTVSGQGGSNAYDVGFHKHSNTLNPEIYFLRSEGSEASPSVVVDGDFLGAISFVGYDGTDYEYGARISVLVDGTPGNNDMPSSMNFYTVPDGSRTATKRLIIGNDGHVALGSSAATTSALLDLQGTSGALLIPRLTTAERDALTATAGMQVYNTTTGEFQCYVASWGSCGGGARSVNADTTLTASDTIAISTTAYEQTWLVYGDTVAVTLAAAPFGASAPVNGARITLICGNATKTVSLAYSATSKGYAGPDITLGLYESVTVEYNSTLDLYFLVSRSN